uniref:Uncharacterized protein n=1 Tax=Phaeomonas parva TaxID=124430 RepID=A0A7S1XNI9_9STRA|mmetsp:Transcript_24750/g.77615  ORF Transcript_24750/g.77615 Transcript_24750/m.77615 type:complete len:296 (+) Transcript_24750:235-1122(+)|eukprot:CAMPEP_0118876282 /NCGR_PEP_ID=MMETSP1163-20130328/17042_1 /TAXON_ID=124430 /ORGANISM="Phaeomonas parva, Strain CCMP2877" /LENGTH=295 /DNA_ID=CAMNT_0006811883 /DNA_START=219 /DNA_END=1106 /DNA_ORIENTATION=-
MSSSIMIHDDYIGKAVPMWGTKRRIAEPVPAAESLRRGGFEGLTQPYEASFTERAQTMGRRHFAPEYSSEAQWRRGRRLIREKPSKTLYDEKRGRRSLEPRKIEDDGGVFHGGVRYTGQREKSGYEYPDAWTLMCASGKNIARDEHGARIQDNRAIEVTLERSMARRRRVPQDPDARLLTMRNGIPCNTPGDKLYSKPDRAPGFYIEGEVVVGSSNVLRPKNGGGFAGRKQEELARTLNTFAAQNDATAALNYRPQAYTYAERQLAARLGQEFQEVQDLTFGGDADELSGDEDED